MRNLLVIIEHCEQLKGQINQTFGSLVAPDHNLVAPDHNLTPLFRPNQHFL